jgi:branched-chain amino acid transport system ATP-binding protein
MEASGSDFFPGFPYTSEKMTEATRSASILPYLHNFIAPDTRTRPLTLNIIHFSYTRSGIMVVASDSSERLSTDFPLLTLRHVTKRFGGITALNDVSFEVQQGELLGIIGPNGAGKSTLLSLISGAQKPTTGEILFGEHHLDRLPPHAIARLGIGRAHQIPRPFGRMTVHQNVLIPVHSRGTAAKHSHRYADEVLEICGLMPKKNELAGSLTLLNLKRLELARALALQPRLLLLDEVAAGLVANEIDEITQLIASIQARGVTIILVEHVQAVVHSLAQRVIVLNWGRKIAEGMPKEVAENPEVVAVYFGAEQEELAPVRQQISAVEKRDANATPLLCTQQISVDYGKLRALRSVDFEVHAGEIVAVIGANGAGKTTLTQAIGGLVPTSEGKILLEGRDITTTPAHQRARQGIALCHEGRRLFREQTIRENLELGAAYASHSSTPFEQRLERVYDLFPILKERAGSLAGRLSGGQQQMVAIGRALMAEPRLLLLDELSLGLAPAIIDQLFASFPHILARGISIVLIEQNVHRSLAIADRVYVLERGSVIFCGTPTEVRAHPALYQAYFGAEQQRPAPPDPT